MPGRAGRNKARRPHQYWNNIAITIPEAQTLATELNLDFPSTSDTYKNSLIYPIRRLIIAGKDTPENLTLLLGPLWSAHLDIAIKQARVEVLSATNPTISCECYQITTARPPLKSPYDVSSSS